MKYILFGVSVLAAILLTGCGGGSGTAVSGNADANSSANSSSSTNSSSSESGTSGETEQNTTIPFTETNITTTDQAKAAYVAFADAFAGDKFNPVTPVVWPIYVEAGQLVCEEDGTHFTTYTTRADGSVDKEMVFGNCQIGNEHSYRNLFGTLITHRLTQEHNLTNESWYETDHFRISDYNNSMLISATEYDGNYSADDWTFTGKVSFTDFQSDARVFYGLHNFPSYVGLFFSGQLPSYGQMLFSITHEPSCSVDGNYSVRFNDINSTAPGSDIFLFGDGYMYINNAVYEFLYSEKQTPSVRITVGNHIETVGDAELKNSGCGLFDTTLTPTGPNTLPTDITLQQNVNLINP